MIKVITTIVPENHMPFEDIQSFETDDYIGMWNHQCNEWIMMERRSGMLFLQRLGNDIYSLKELDDAVYYAVEEHIVSVSESSEYQFKIIEN